MRNTCLCRLAFTAENELLVDRPKRIGRQIGHEQCGEGDGLGDLDGSSRRALAQVWSALGSPLHPLTRVGRFPG
jgi:hypothetical protein